ncbi:MAG: GTP-binding protein [Promethearchaeota archaeon]
MSTYDYTWKVLLLGDDPAAKTSFTKRFCYNIFNLSERLTIGVDFHVKTIELNNQRIKLQIWDVGGEKRFRFLLPTYCLGANGAIFMYDITKPSTLDNISEWTNIVRAKGGPIPIMLVGSKLYSGESRAVSKQEGVIAAEKNDLSAFAEICPETGQNVDRVFEVLGDLLIKRLSSDRIELADPPKLLKSTDRKIRSEFIVNDYLKLRLENAKTNIYVGGRLFNRCKYLLLNLPRDNFKRFDNIESIDEAAVKLDRSMERSRPNEYISPETEFWGHCSNLQTWYECNYDTRILHRSLAFPLLKALVEVGDKRAKKVFKEQIALRLENGYPSVVWYLINEGYLKYLNSDELNTILEKPKFIKNLPKWFKNSKLIPGWLTKRIKAKLKELKCPYCGSKVSQTSIHEFLNGKPMICELCYTDIIDELSGI